MRAESTACHCLWTSGRRENSCRTACVRRSEKHKQSPFKEQAVFVELDATTARFDERGIADPLIGSVHDPIYQGAGAMGQAGIPQPKQELLPMPMAVCCLLMK